MPDISSELHKLDRRVRYTRMVVRDSFVRLLQEKALAKITVKEICELADINRATFYTHFEDQYDLLRQIEDEVTNEINERLGSVAYGNGGSEAIDMLANIIEYIRDNAELCSVLLSGSGDVAFQKKIIMIVQQKCMSEWAATRSFSADDAEYIYIFAASGSVGIIQKWLSSGTKKAAREMAELIFKLAFQGNSAF